MLKSVTRENGLEMALTSLVAGRLAVLVGAGLSMAPPSQLPSAATLAAKARSEYEARFPGRPPLSADIAAQAEFFFAHGELATVYLRTLIDWHAFAGRHNPGHEAIADLLLVQAIQTAVTTNVDCLIEAAGQQLLGQIGAGIDAASMVALSPATAPLLKIHGSWCIDPSSTVWAPSQPDSEPLASRITENAAWLKFRLADRDLLIVGYWSDWDYLNAVLERTLGAIRPACVIVIDPADPATFPAKAPELHALGTRAKSHFYHLQESGADFLDALRKRFSQSYVSQVLHAGREGFVHTTRHEPDAVWLSPPDIDNRALWEMRRDIEGCTPNQPATERSPSCGPIFGLMLLTLRSKGAIPQGPYWELAGKRIRMLRAENKILHLVQAEFERDVPPLLAPDIVIAVGAENFGLPTDLVRSSETATVARGRSSQWFTRDEASKELGL